jgi:hypothetical protein
VPEEVGAREGGQRRKTCARDECFGHAGRRWLVVVGRWARLELEVSLETFVTIVLVRDACFGWMGNVRLAEKVMASLLADVCMRWMGPGICTVDRYFGRCESVQLSVLA